MHSCAKHRPPLLVFFYYITAMQPYISVEVCPTPPSDLHPTQDAEPVKTASIVKDPGVTYVGLAFLP